MSRYPAPLALILAMALWAPLPAGAQDQAATDADAEVTQACLDREDDPRACVGAASDLCQDQEPDGMTTVGMTICTLREIDWWQGQLDAAYDGLRETYDAEIFAPLREAQEAWTAFRDADCQFQYAVWQDGTIRSLFHVGCMLDHTASRAIALRGYGDWSEL